MKRVVFTNRFFWPALPATGQLLTDLAVGLARRGWEVTVITSRPAQSALPAVEHYHGVKIHRVTTLAEPDRTLLRKGVAFLQFTAGALVKIFGVTRRGTILVAMTDPPLVSFAFGFAARLRAAKVVFWLQDLYPEIAAAVSGKGWLNLLRYPRNAALTDADLCVAISESIASVAQENAPRPRLTVIENWAPFGITPQGRQSSAVQRFRQAHGWEDRFVVQYSGNLGRVHDLMPVVEAARMLSTAPRVRLVVLGKGPQRSRLETRMRELKLDNVEFLDPVPRSDLAVSLSAADLHLVTLKAGCERFVYPSKLYGIVAAGRPILFVGPVECETARAIVQRGWGLAVEATLPAQIAEAIRVLAHDEAQVARMAAATVGSAATVSAERAVAQWISALENVRAC